MVRKSAAVAAIMILAFSVVSIMIPSDTDAASSYTVKDGTGAEFSFESAPEHIATVGTGITATAIQIGALEKIVVTDKYTKDNSSSVFKDLKDRISDGKVRANGSGWTSGQSDLLADIIYMSEKGVLDKNDDLIIITGSYSTLSSFVDNLKKLGFEKVMVWQDIKDYTEISAFVESVSKAINGEVSSYVEQMDYVAEYIAEHLEGVEKKKGMFITFSSGDYKVGNKGSLANSMINAAGGISISEDSSKSGSTYGDKNTMASLIIANPDAVLFLNSSVADNQEQVNEISAMGNDSNKLVALDSLWNNYSIASMDGVWTMACALYPDIFEGDVPTVESDEEDNLMLYAGIAVAAMAIIGIVAFLIIRR